ncbi:MAG: hypothetical protein AB7S38_38595 [Vulcanimicrobiota bacterium]
MHSISRIALPLVLTLFLAASATAQEGKPSGAVQAFWAAVSSKNYAGSWSLLSKHSQDTIITRVAKDEKMDVTKVRKMFESNSPQTQRGFWDSFRTSSKADVFAQGKFKTVSSNNKSAQVTMDGVDPSKLTFKVFREGQTWKVGLIETFPL